MIRLQMSKKQTVFLAATVLVVALLFAALYLTRPAAELTPETTAQEDVGIDPLFSDMIALIEKQKQADEMLLEELHSGAYSFDDPLVVVDPYGFSPLAALALFTSGEPLNITVHVSGKTEHAGAEFTFDGYNTEHMIPIYGLYPEARNRVTLTAETLSGSVRSVVLSVQTDPLPPELEKNIILTDLAQPGSYQPGFNYTFTQKSAFDINGEYRWFLNDFMMRPATIYDYNGNMIMAKGSYFEGDLLFFEINALGKIFSVYYSPYGVHHDVAAAGGGNLLANGSRGMAQLDFIYEIDVRSGEITNTLDLKEILQRTRASNLPEYLADDWFHHNATVYDKGSIIVSGRHQSAVAKLSWPEGRLEWILSDHSGWNQMFHKYLLTPIGDGFEWSYCQHSPEILPDFDDDPDTIDILLFDNGSARFEINEELRRAIANGEIVDPEPYSRMVHYRINEKAKTIEQIWQFGKELGGAYYSYGRSDANLLENGNRLGTFDRYDANNSDSGTSLVEADARGNVVWEAYATSNDATGSFGPYRIERRPLYTPAANDLRIGAEVRNFIPEEKLR